MRLLSGLSIFLHVLLLSTGCTTKQAYCPNVREYAACIENDQCVVNSQQFATYLRYRRLCGVE